MKELRDLLAELRKDYKGRTVYLYSHGDDTYADNTIGKFALTDELTLYDDLHWEDLYAEDWEIFDDAPEIAIYTNIEDD